MGEPVTPYLLFDAAKARIFLSQRRQAGVLLAETREDAVQCARWFKRLHGVHGKGFPLSCTERDSVQYLTNMMPDKLQSLDLKYSLKSDKRTPSKLKVLDSRAVATANV